MWRWGRLDITSTCIPDSPMVIKPSRGWFYHTALSWKSSAQQSCRNEVRLIRFICTYSWFLFEHAPSILTSGIFFTRVIRSSSLNTCPEIPAVNYGSWVRRLAGLPKTVLVSARIDCLDFSGFALNFIGIDKILKITVFKFCKRN